MKKLYPLLIAVIALAFTSCNSTKVQGGDGASGWKLLSEISPGSSVVSGVLENADEKRNGRHIIGKPSYVLEIEGGDHPFKNADAELLYVDKDWWKKLFKVKKQWKKLDSYRFAEKICTKVSNGMTFLGVESTLEYNCWEVAQNGEFSVRIGARIYLKNKLFPDYVMSDSIFLVRLRGGKVVAIINSR